MNDRMVKAIVYAVGVAAICAIVYGCYWVAKNVSYSIFYKDMVKQTIVQTVKPEALR